MSARGLLFKLHRPRYFHIIPQRIANRAVLCRRQIDRAQSLILLDSVTPNSKIECDGFVSARSGINSLSYDVDLERFHRSALLPQNFDNVH